MQGSIQTGTAEPLVVPLDSVRTDQPAPYVQVADQGRVAHHRVQTGVRSLTDGQMLVAVDGVPEGALVLAGRVGVLPQGTALRLAPAAPSPAKP